MQPYADNGSGLVSAFAEFMLCPYYYPSKQKIWNELTRLYEKSISSISVEDFLCPELINAFAELAGQEMADKLPELLSLRLNGQFSSSINRRSFRTKEFKYYTTEAVNLICLLLEQACYSETVAERLYYPDGIHNRGYEYLLALEICRDNKEIISLIHEAIMGDNSEILLSRCIIDAIIISGNETLLDELMHLLLAARQQEGLRQQILEAADGGHIHVLIRMLKLCLDENLFRYSSTIRAFDVWTGLGYGDQKPAAVKKLAQYAYDCLTDEQIRLQYQESSDNTQAYFALWAQGCHEFSELNHITQQLLSNSSHHKKILGWFFVSRSDSCWFRMTLAD